MSAVFPSFIKRRAVWMAAAAVAACVPAATAWAQAFPSKPVTLIVPWPAGGSTDRHLRDSSAQLTIRQAGTRSGEADHRRAIGQ